MFLLLLMCTLLAGPEGEESGSIPSGKLLGHVKAVSDTLSVPGAPDIVERRRYSPGGCLSEYTISTGFDKEVPIFKYACDEHCNILEKRKYLPNESKPKELVIYKYDDKEHVTEEQGQDGSGNVKYTLTYSYDKAGHCTEKKRMEGASLISLHLYKYNAAGNLERDSSAEGEKQACAYYRHDAKGKAMEYVFNEYAKNFFSSTKEVSKRDAKGNETEVVHTETDTAKNFKKVMTYQDTLPIEIREYKSAGLSSIRTYRYDKIGHVIETTYHSYLDLQPVNGKNTYKWNERGDKTEEIGYKQDGNFDYQLNYEYIYDAMGNMIRESHIKNAERTVIRRRSIEYY